LIAIQFKHHAGKRRKPLHALPGQAFKMLNKSCQLLSVHPLSCLECFTLLSASPLQDNIKFWRIQENQRINLSEKPLVVTRKTSFTKRLQIPSLSSDASSSLTAVRS